jgi:hypothetical protein
VNDLRTHRVDDSEVDLFRVMTIIWQEKKPILFYSVLIVVGAVMFSYVQPKYYETHMDAFVLPSKGNTSHLQQFLPLEYYERFSRSPETLNAVLERLPNDVKFEENILPLDHLTSMLRVESRITKSAPGLASSALQLTFYVRHTDPSSAYHIAKIWREVLDNNFSKYQKSVISTTDTDAEIQLNLSKLKTSKEKWEATVAKVVESKKNNSTEKKIWELNSVRQLNLSTFSKIQALKRQIEQQIEQQVEHSSTSKKIFRISKKVSGINEQYISKNNILSGYKKQLKLQPVMLSTFMGDQKQIQGPESGDTGKSGVLNPVYTQLQMRILTLDENFNSRGRTKGSFAPKI